MNILKKFFLIVIICHVSVLFVKGQNTSGPTLGNDGNKAAEREATTQSMSTVDYSSKNISEGNTNITMTESTATTEAMNVSTIENATEGMTSATVVTATTVVTTTEATTGTVTENITEVASTGITETISLGASNSSSTNPSETTAPSTSVNTSSGVTEKVSSLSTSQEMMNTTQPTTKDSTATLSTLKESDENNSTMEESNTVTSPSISENQSSSVKPLETSNGMKSTRVTTTSTETEATEVSTTISPTNYMLMHTGAIGITSQFKLQCKNHTVDSLKGMLLLPCTVETSVDIQFNKTSLKWKTADGTNRMVISGEKKYGVMLNITAKQENSTEYTGYINFDQDSEFGKKIELTLSVFLINGENKEDKFDVQFIDSPGAAANVRGSIFFTVVSVIILIVYLF